MSESNPDYFENLKSTVIDFVTDIRDYMVDEDNEYRNMNTIISKLSCSSEQKIMNIVIDNILKNEEKIKIQGILFFAENQSMLKGYLSSETILNASDENKDIAARYLGSMLEIARFHKKR